MLDAYFMKGVEKWRKEKTGNFTVWRFPASPGAYEKQIRPLVYNYSIMTRAYGCRFNPDDMITFFNNEGFDVYLVDWGENSIFTLRGWTLDDLADHLGGTVILPLAEAYGVDSVNIFGVCIGGVIISCMIGMKKKEIADKLHRVAYYGVPIFGARDLGMEKSFRGFYKAMRPFEPIFKEKALSLFLLDQMILYSGSLSMLSWTWAEYFKENTDNSVGRILQWTYDDRWVPFQALMDVIAHGFNPDEKETEFHLSGDLSDIHFLNIVGDDDMLVKPSASIIEWNSRIPDQYRSFKQMILNTDHFMFARPGFKEEKAEVARWFAGYDFASLIYKLATTTDEKFRERADTLITDDLMRGYERASAQEQAYFVDRFAKLLDAEGETDMQTLAAKLAETVKARDYDAERGFFEEVWRYAVPMAHKSGHRGGTVTVETA